MVRRFVDLVKINQVPLLIFVVSRLLVALALFLTRYYVTPEATLNQWDGPHYLSIAEYGYINNGTYTEEGSFIAFLPFWPLLIKFISVLTTLSSQTAALILSFVCGLIALCVFYQLVKNRFSPTTAQIATALVAFYPFSVFLSAPYTESLFLFLTVITLWFMERKKWYLAASTIALACITRLTGFVLIPTYFIALWYSQKAFDWKAWLGGITLMALPFSFFLYYQYLHFGTPTAFLLAQKINWHHQATWPWTGLKTVFNLALYDTTFATMWRIDLFFILLMLTTLGVGYRQVPKLWLTLGGGIILLTLSQTYILGSGRYMMMVLPAYIIWAQLLQKWPWLSWFIIFISASWMMFNAHQFSLSRLVF